MSDPQRRATFALSVGVTVVLLLVVAAVFGLMTLARGI